MTINPETIHPLETPLTLERIFSFLDLSSIGRCAQVSYKWKPCATQTMWDLAEGSKLSLEPDSSYKQIKTIACEIFQKWTEDQEAAKLLLNAYLVIMKKKNFSHVSIASITRHFVIHWLNPRKPNQPEAQNLSAGLQQQKEAKQTTHELASLLYSHGCAPPAMRHQISGMSIPCGRLDGLYPNLHRPSAFSGSTKTAIQEKISFPREVSIEEAYHFSVSTKNRFAPGELVACMASQHYKIPLQSLWYGKVIEEIHQKKSLLYRVKISSETQLDLQAGSLAKCPSLRRAPEF